MSSKKILHVIKGLKRGGAERLLVETLKKHDRDTFTFHYVYFDSESNDFVSALRAAGGQVTCLPTSNDPWSLVKTTLQLKDYIVSNDIDVIHSHLPISGVISRLAGYFSKSPVIYTEHSVWDNYNLITRKLNSSTYFLNTSVVAVSEGVKNCIYRFSNYDKKAIKLIKNGVDTSYFQKSDCFSVVEDLNRKYSVNLDDKLVLGTVARFNPEKRLDLLLEIFSKILESRSDVFLILVGGGKLEEKLKERAKELKLNEYIHFAGIHEDVRPFLNMMDVFVLPSKTEGLPVSLLEAMSMKCVPITTNVGGIPEVIENKYNGYMVDVEDVYKIASIITQIDRTSSKFKNLQDKARQTVVENYSIENMVPMIEKLYKTLI